MQLTETTVVRGIVLLEADAFGVRQLKSIRERVAIARCDTCGRRARVLPVDVLPHKTYGTAAIEHVAAFYARGDQSLRHVASQLGDRDLAHATVHAWTEGLGAHALGRGSATVAGAPMSRFVADAAARTPQVTAVLQQDVTVDPRRYRSHARRERLQAMTRLLLVAVLVAGLQHPDALAECRRLMLAWSRMAALQFRTGWGSTRFERIRANGRARSGSSSPTSHKRCPTRTRSPPDATR